MEYLLNKNNRFYWMGLAMLLVIAAHLVNFRSLADPAFRIAKMVFHSGGVGVNIFFFISAYGLCHSYANHPLSTFYKNRLIRLYPIYGLFLLVALMWFCPQERPLLVTLYQVTGLAVVTDTIEWFVPSLTLLYIAFPLLYACTKWAIERSYLIVFGVILGCTILYYTLSHDLHPCLSARINSILLGICTYHFEKQELSKRDYIALLSLTAILTLFTFQDCEFHFYIPLLLFALNECEIKMPLKTSISFIGEHSLEIYLGQTIGLQYCYTHWHGFILTDAAFGLGISIGMAILFGLVQHATILAINALKKS